MKKDPFVEALKKTVAASCMIHAAIVAAVAFLAAPGGNGTGGLGNWPVLALAAVLGVLGAFLWILPTRAKPTATGTSLDRLGAMYGLTRRTRKTFTLPFATIRVMEKDKDFRRRIKRAATRRPQDFAAYIFKQVQEGGLG